MTIKPSYLFPNQQDLASTKRLFLSLSDKTNANSAAELSVFNSGIGNLSIPANWWIPGKIIQFDGYVKFSTTIVAPSLTVYIYLDSVMIGSATAGNLVANANNSPGQISGIITCRSIGLSGSLVVSGTMNYTVSGTRYFSDFDSVTTVDTTKPAILDIRTKWNTASAQNTITIRNAIIRQG